MQKLIALAVSTAMIAGAMVHSAYADENAELVINGETLVTKLAAPEGHPLDEILSGWRFRSSETQAFEMDDFDNPGFVAVDYGLELWEQAEGTENKSCASCHEDISSLKGVRAAMPKWNADAQKPWALEMWINDCRTERMGAKAWKWEATEMLAMTAAVGLQSRGMPMKADLSGPMQSWVDKGKEIYYTRVGQLDLACSHCHEDNYGNMIRADHLSQGQINGFPVYRLKWQGLGSIHRRFKGCMDNVRATPWKRGSDEFLALEAYLTYRGEGLAIETPAVRN